MILHEGGLRNMAYGRITSNSTLGNSVKVLVGSEELEGVKQIKIDTIVPDSLVRATIDCHVQVDDFTTKIHMSEENFIEAAKYYGYVIEKVV